MKKANYHTHTTGSDGKSKPEDWIKIAIRKKIDILGITDHYHFPPNFRDWGNEYYSVEHYEELKRLKRKYKTQIKILVNVEFDWLEDYKRWIKNEAMKRKYDLKFVSVHFIKTKKEYIPLDWKEEGFKEMIKSFGSVKKLVTWYYSTLRNAIKTGCFDVVGHLDIIKIWNKNKKYFSGQEDWYKKEIQKTLKLIKKKNMKIDLNTSGLRKPCAEQYPSLDILKEAKKMKIPLLIGTDAHKSEELESGIEELKEVLTEI
jgi:histidinol-phosphatase (PHP family)